MACTESRPTPGHAKMVSVMTEPPSSVPSSIPTMVTIGIEAFLSACFHDHRRLAHALRARRADVVLAEHLEHPRAGEPRDARGGEEPEGDGGQDEVLDVRRGPRRAASSSRTEKTRISMMPSQNVGMAWPSSATTVET